MSVAEESRTIAARLQWISEELCLTQALADEDYIRLFFDMEFARRMLAKICANCARPLSSYGDSLDPRFCSLCYMGRADSDGERIPEEEDEEEEQQQEEEEEEEEDDKEEEEEAEANLLEETPNSEEVPKGEDEALPVPNPNGEEPQPQVAMYPKGDQPQPNPNGCQPGMPQHMNEHWMLQNAKKNMRIMLNEGAKMTVLRAQPKQKGRMKRRTPYRSNGLIKALKEEAWRKSKGSSIIWALLRNPRFYWYRRKAFEHDLLRLLE